MMEGRAGFSAGQLSTLPPPTPVVFFDCHSFYYYYYLIAILKSGTSCVDYEQADILPSEFHVS